MNNRKYSVQFELFCHLCCDMFEKYLTYIDSVQVIYNWIKTLLNIIRDIKIFMTSMTCIRMTWHWITKIWMTTTEAKLMVQVTARVRTRMNYFWINFHWGVRWESWFNFVRVFFTAWTRAWSWAWWRCCWWIKVIIIVIGDCGENVLWVKWVVLGEVCVDL